MIERRHYSAEERSAAVGLATSVGVKAAGRRLGIPYRTISHWMARPDTQLAIATTHEAILDTLKAATAEGAASLLAIIRNPKAADRDKVRAAEVAIDRYQLLTGGATSRSENLNIGLTDSLTDEQRDVIEEHLHELARTRLLARGALQLAGVSDDALASLDETGVPALSRDDVTAVQALIEQLEADSGQ